MLSQLCTLPTFSGTVRGMCDSEGLEGTRKPHHPLPTYDSLNVMSILMRPLEAAKESPPCTSGLQGSLSRLDRSPHRPQEIIPTRLPSPLPPEARCPISLLREHPAGITGPSTQARAPVTAEMRPGAPAARFLSPKLPGHCRQTCYRETGF